MTEERHDAACSHAEGFAHDALLYAGDDGFVEEVAPFVREGVEAGQAVLVAVPARRAAKLERALDGHASRVLFANMEELGRNPGRIIPAWRDFVDEHTAQGRLVRGVGEPVWAERTADEMVECRRHEALLNLAFGANPPWTLLCPYDVTTLSDDAIAEAWRTHPFMWDGGRRVRSDTYVDPLAALELYDEDLPDPPVEPERMSFGRDDIAVVRALVAHHAALAGLSPEREADLVLAASEAATNSVLHGGGRGDFAVWRDGDAVVGEVRDRGRIHDPRAGRRRPTLDALDGRGLWIVHQLCDLVEVRPRAHGTVVRFRIAR
jgi:anti-sigma regulatory factor (Ser/Thr protein kinase)